MTLPGAQLELISIWTDILEPAEYSWALFQFGTAVLLHMKDPKQDLEQLAYDMMAMWAIPVPGTPSNQGAMRYLTDHGIPGCIVSCHHPDIMTYVAPAEAPIADFGLYAGIKDQIVNFGKKKRQWDCETLQIIYLKDNRQDSPK